VTLHPTKTGTSKESFVLLQIQVWEKQVVLPEVEILNEDVLLCCIIKKDFVQ
jgi:hypothetical protein